MSGVGRIRIAMAAALNSALAPWGVTVEASELEVNRSRPNGGDGACSWSVRRNACGGEVYGFEPMRECLRKGFMVLHLKDGSLNIYTGRPGQPDICSCFCDACKAHRKTFL